MEMVRGGQDNHVVSALVCGGVPPKGLEKGTTPTFQGYVILDAKRQ